MSELYKSASTWWVTGGSSGIGRDLCLNLASRGMRIAVSARKVDKLNELAQECSKLGAECLVVPADLTNTLEAEQAYKEIIDSFGSLNVFVGNAGTYLPANAKELSTSDVLYEMEINYGGFVRCVSAVLPDMVAKGQGHIVGISSVAGYRGLPNSAGYGASKAAMTHFMESLRLDLFDTDILVTTVHPGFVKTPLTDKNDFDMPFIIDSERAAELIVQDIQKGRWDSHFPKKFSLIMKFLSIWPQRCYYRLIRCFTKESD